MLRASGNGHEQFTTVSSKPQHEGEVVEPDNRIVFAVLAVGMLVGALLTTPAKTPASVRAKAPTPAPVSAMATKSK